MTDDQVCLRSATELAAMIRSRELSSRELLELFLAGSSGSTRPSTRS